jgi:hypothetical protein
MFGVSEIVTRLPVWVSIRTDTRHPADQGIDLGALMLPSASRDSLPNNAMLRMRPTMPRDYLE